MWLTKIHTSGQLEAHGLYIVNLVYYIWRHFELFKFGVGKRLGELLTPL